MFWSEIIGNCTCFTISILYTQSTADCFIPVSLVIVLSDYLVGSIVGQSQSVPRVRGSWKFTCCCSWNDEAKAACEYRPYTCGLVSSAVPGNQAYSRSTVRLSHEVCPLTVCMVGCWSTALCMCTVQRAQQASKQVSKNTHAHTHTYTRRVFEIRVQLQIEQQPSDVNECRQLQ